jgi:hypothetical protein
VYVHITGAVHFWTLFHFLSFVPYVRPGACEYRGALDQKAILQLMTEKTCGLNSPRCSPGISVSKRDDVLVARSAYSVVREFLLEINELIVHHQRDINVYDYIQEYTSLARSTIIKILSDLKKGQYIVVEKGRLLNMTTLPEKY